MNKKVGKTIERFRTFLAEECFDLKKYKTGKYDEKIFNWFTLPQEVERKEIGYINCIKCGKQIVNGNGGWCMNCEIEIINTPKLERECKCCGVILKDCPFRSPKPLPELPEKIRWNNGPVTNEEKIQNLEYKINEIISYLESRDK